MKYGCSLEMVNMLTSSLNFIYKQSKSFWVDYFKFIAAAGFKGIELPFNPFGGDPMAFETGRCGIPLSAGAIQAKYGSPDEFLAFLNDVGIEKVVSIHMNANDVQLEANVRGYSRKLYFELLEEMGLAAVAHAASLKAECLVVSPSPELGWLNKYGIAEDDVEFEDATVVVLNTVAKAAKGAGIALALKAEYWSFFRGKRLAGLQNSVAGALMAPDLAHLQIAGDPVTAVVKAHAHETACLHLCDTAFKDTVGNYARINAEIPVDGAQKVFCDLGEGDVDLLGAMKALKDSGYDGWVIAEQRKTPDVYRGLLKMRWFIDHEIEKKLGEA
ncbi:sugar phosphate isomerase/epimerase [Ruminococcaceae bacterium OttesenSCG-928-D13]|nr:sugar phosphate isomerase/epimerase [Ruminococcaceae bacterium OttesenSCG-928-D13]